MPIHIRSNQAWEKGLLLLLGLLTISFFYGHFTSIHYGPVSHHYWRQADGASIARMYYENDLRFFEPKVHNQVGGHNHAVGEFPIIYYAAAILYTLFTPDDTILKGLHYLVLMLGLLALFSTLHQRLENKWLSIVPPLFLFSSPLIAYFSLNFLPNTIGLGLFMIGIWLFNHYLKSEKIWIFSVFISVLTLMALIKITLLIPWIALVCTSMVLQLTKFETKHRTVTLPPLSLLLIGSGTVLLACGFWLWWASDYNAKHGAGIFLMQIKPIWSMPSRDAAWTGKHLIFEQRKMYFNLITLLFLTGWLCWILLNPRAVYRPVYYLTLFTTLGSFLYVLLFFNQLAIHSYYILDIFPLFTLLFVTLTLKVDTLLSKVKTSNLAYSTLLFIPVLLFSNIYASSNQQKIKNTPGGEFIQPPFPSLLKKRELNQFLEEYQIKYPEMAVVIPDISPNTLLHHLNLRGWSYSHPIAEEQLRQFAEWGGRYLILADEALLNDERLLKATSRPIGVFDHTIYFFDLQVMLD